MAFSLLFDKWLYLVDNYKDSNNDNTVVITAFHLGHNFDMGFCRENFIIFSSTGRRPASLCHGLLSVGPSVRLCVNFFF